MNPTAVVKMLLLSDPRCFQKLKQNGAQYVFDMINGFFLIIVASYHKLISKKKKIEAVVHVEKKN